MTILIFFAVLLVLIVVHEFGHFIVAKKLGIRVDEFGVGFPPKLFGKKYGETEYTINAIPFGGFVKIFGENPDEESTSGPDKDRALMHKPKLVQAAVLFAGVFFNMLLAWVLFSITFMSGVPVLNSSQSENLIPYLSDERIVITQVLKDSPAEKALLIPGDEIVSLSVVPAVAGAASQGGDAVAPLNVRDVSAFVNTHGKEPVTLAFKRNGVSDTAIITPQKGLITGASEVFAIGVGTGLVSTLQLPVHLAIFEGGKQTFNMLYRVTVGIGTFLYDAVLFKADLSTIAGPVGIVGLVGDATALGFMVLLNFTAIISLNLAVINLIPFPALDGGRLLFLLIEAIKGSPIKPQIANAFNFIGFALLILLMLVVTYGDIMRLVG